MSVEFDKAEVMTFDCYGTLIDWESGLLSVLQPWLREAGVAVPDDIVLLAFGMYSERYTQMRPALLYPEVLRRSWLDMQRHFGIALNEEQAVEFSKSAGTWPAFADSPAALNALAKKYKLIILSNIDNASIAQSQKTLDAPFHAVVTAEQVGSYKPEKRHFNRAIELLAKEGIDKSKIIHVGQSRFHDIEPARELGIPSVFVYRRHKKGGTGASIAADVVEDLLVNSMQELAEAAGCA
ncbi:HAD-IA family hydrolase [Mesorhizobium sp.]|uniref:HAD-IA family hydrolase n=1 Tax=Mesorhizobium sp. TaxID=1871066 RepID=UPI000FE953F1|nr:HAD-IA family hydrolase [Mesorhizobium sp.]RWC30015.1 MAG: haloacid dehalogenase [Mesorhizobium sp.]TIX28168.1 MAG: haloacid dehalogenase [Mesorhizobium sp.]